jgi:hypothetical protein
MASEVFKFLHSRRRLNTENAINRQVEIAKTYNVPVTEKHRYAKHNVLNCGQKGCIFCANPRKLFDEKTLKEKSFEQRRLYEEYDFEE